MGLQVDVQTLAVTGGNHLYFGCNFQWVNNSSSPAYLTCCGSFCTQANYTVPAASNGQPGMVAASLMSAPAFNFGDSAFTAPGAPHIVVGSGPIPTDGDTDGDNDAADDTRDVA